MFAPDSFYLFAKLHSLYYSEGVFFLEEAAAGGIIKDSHSTTKASNEEGEEHFLQILPSTPPDLVQPQSPGQGL